MQFSTLSIFFITLLAIPGVTVAAPLTLKECLERGKRNNPSVVVAKRDSAIAAIGAKHAKAAFYPRLDMQGGYTMQLESQAVEINGRSAETQQADFAYANAALVYTLYDFGRRDARRLSAQSSADAEESNVLTREQDTSMQIIATFYGILEAGKLVKAAEEEALQVAEHLKIASIMFDQGVVTRNDVLQAEVRLASAKQKLLSMRNRLDNLRLQLNFLTGADPASREDLVEQVEIPSETAVLPEPKKALEKRPEIRALKKRIEASAYDLSESNSAWYPEIFSRLALDYVQNDRVREQTIMSATIGLKMNIFDGYATTTAKQRAVSIKARADETLRLAEAQFQLELATAVNDSRVARERIAVTETAIRQSEENLRINKDRYQARVGTATDVLDAQTLLTQSKTEHYSSIYDLQVAVARIKRAMGEL
ncbi:TolC family protein [Geobacter pelophilus]|uniref:TolC family protein n=1 Tax=Geoanaerobacter pelophilus TaxID=60036 RepID=A0AAW4KX58_9BACT|nr:TolC family protein [Geoanaerobacter pelophilus]MBT0662909.1 TolC family protein [Geoanaerobacter pelophilus]